MPSILLHELGHAWVRDGASAETRARFLEHWGLDSWNDRNDDWSDRGVERAADTIAYTLLQTEPTDNPNILRFVCGYELLTGLPVPIEARTTCPAA